VLLNLCCLGAALVFGVSMRDSFHDASEVSHTLEAEMLVTKVVAERARDEAALRIAEIEQETAEEIQRLSDAFEARRRKELSAVAEREVLVREAAAREEAARITAIGDLRQELSAVQERMRSQMDQVEARWSRELHSFQRIQVDWDASIFLIHSEFVYTTQDEQGEEKVHTGTGWGTGFVVGEEGFIVTNKHVVQPWKFDAELAAMAAMGEVEIQEDSLRIAAWPSGTPCMTDDRQPDLDVGFNNRQRANLVIAGMAPDSLVTRTLELGGGSVDYTLHDLDNNDLVILKAANSSLRPVVCAPFGDTAPVTKLDRVMALGFPRGQKGLEGRIAETSPSLGTVRKVESTIHITASIIPGNSGGPLFNADGRVVGIATRIYSETLGICIKIDHVLALLSRVRSEDQGPPAATARPIPEAVAEAEAAGN
jgi:S1-C subfamily serine protease